MIYISHRSGHGSCSPGIRIVVSILLRPPRVGEQLDIKDRQGGVRRCEEKENKEPDFTRTYGAEESE